MDAAFVIGGSQPPDDNKISPIKGGRMPVRDLVIYELMMKILPRNFAGHAHRWNICTQEFIFDVWRYLDRTIQWRWHRYRATVIGVSPLLCR
jgi:hypothetical protein